VQNGYLDQVPVEAVKDYQARLTEYLTTSHGELLRTIADQQSLGDPLVAALKAAVETFGVVSGFSRTSG
jgi:F-type H+/Na+-transporting ATPase subunit alpha